MSSRGYVPIYTKPFHSTDTIYPLNNYKIKQITNLVVSNPEKVLPPDWHPPGYVPEEEVEHLKEVLKPTLITFDYDEFYLYHTVNYIDGPTIYNWFNSQLGREHFGLPELPDNYYYHVTCQSIFYEGVTSLGVLPRFNWSLSYLISDDHYVLFKRENLNNTVLNRAHSSCFPVNTNKFVYCSYDVTLGAGQASYSNLVGSLQQPLTADSWTLLDFGPNDESDPNGRTILVDIDDEDLNTFENNIDHIYFRCWVYPELKVEE